MEAKLRAANLTLRPAIGRISLHQASVWNGDRDIAP
jgi:hypothetical protein